MDTTYNLADNVAESFSLALKGKDGTALKYNIKYPNTDEMRAMVKAANDLEELIKVAATKEEIETKSKESEQALNSLITPVDHEFSFSEVFGMQPINVQRQFRKIIQKEFGDGEG